MKTPRRLVQDTLEFQLGSSRIPRELWLLNWARLHHGDMVDRIASTFPNDIVRAPWFFREPVVRKGSPFEAGLFVDEWGCTFENLQPGIEGEVKNHQVEEWSDIEKVRPPSAMLTVEKDQVNAYCKATDRFVLAGGLPRPFERLQFLRGTEQLFMDFLTDPDEVKRLLNIVHGHYLKEVEVWAETDIDGMMFMDDWGSQNSLLIAPDLWRELFKPIYKDYVDALHAKGKKVFLHSDGNILAIYPDLIELGFDALNSQLFCMGVENLKPFAGKITFWGEIDRQHLLPNGSVEDINRAVRSVYDHLYANGGLIAECEFGPGARPENVYEVFKSFDSLQG